MIISFDKFILSFIVIKYKLFDLSTNSFKIFNTIN